MPFSIHDEYIQGNISYSSISGPSSLRMKHDGQQV